MGRLPAALLAELQRPDPDVTTVFEIDLPDGTTWKLSEQGVSIRGEGHYEQRIKAGSLSAWSMHAIDWNYRLVTPQPSFRLLDHDRRLSDLLGTQEPLEGCSARAYLLQKGALRADWWQSFGGIVAALPRQSERDEWDVSFRPDDRALGNDLTRTKIATYDFPNARQRADETVEGMVAPILVGVISDLGGTQRGRVKCRCVDTVAYKYLVGRGYYQVPVVYSPAGTRKTTGYSIIYELRGGRLYTLIDATADWGDDVWCDVYGHDTDGDGTGDLICEPTAVVTHVLSNWAAEDWESGPWFGAPAWLNVANLAALVSVLRGRAGGASFASSCKIDGSLTGLEFLQRWSASAGVHPYWSHDGLLSWAVDEIHVTGEGVYPAAIMRPWHDQGDSLRHSCVDRQFREVDITYAETQQFEVFDPLAKGGGRDSVDAPFGVNTQP
jgi:hypothetical protein